MLLQGPAMACVDIGDDNSAYTCMPCIHVCSSLCKGKDPPTRDFQTLHDDGMLRTPC